MLKIRITPTFQRYYSPDTHFGIYNFSTKEEIPQYNNTAQDFDGNTLYCATIVGTMQNLNIGVEYEAYIHSPTLNEKYKSLQYKVDTISPIKPKTQAENAKYLSTIVTQKQAETLLSVYPDIVDMILNEDEIDLSKVKGIAYASFAKIKSKVIENYANADIFVMLKPLGITDKMINKLQTKYANPTVLGEKLRANPYVLTELKGLGFKKVDQIALKLNPELKTSLFRTKSYIEFKLDEIANSDGHTLIPLEMLSKYVGTDIGTCTDIYNEFIEREKANGNTLKFDGKSVGLMRFYNIERSILDQLNNLNESVSSVDTSKLDFESAFNEFEKEKGYAPTEEQKSAILGLKGNNVVIMTGNAGSGKSTVISIATKVFKDYKISQCALSAKASRRIVETTGLDAKTIHRTIGKHDDEDVEKVKYIDSELIVIDEYSMVNASISLELFNSVKKGTKLLICFDDAQLPPIGFGNVATDLLNSRFSVNRLTKVHRQAQDSGILSDANIIRTGVNPIKEPKTNLCRGNLKDMFYMFRNDRQEIYDLVIQYYMKSLTTLSLDDVCICVPRKNNTLISTESFNIKIQELLLGDVKEHIKHRDMVFKKGTKVIQRKNNYEKDVVNGETGYITHIDNSTKKYVVDFGDKKVEFSFDSIEDMELAYALSIHATQGSQYDTVIVPIAMDSYILLCKELLYTAITRASKRCLVIAEPKAFNYACKKHANKRNTWLQKMLKM